MPEKTFSHQPFDSVFNDLTSLQSLTNRMDIMPALVRRLEEESIARLIDISTDYIKDQQAELRK